MARSLYSNIKKSFCFILTAILIISFSFGGVTPIVHADGVNVRDFNKYGYRYSYENGILTESQKNIYDSLIILCDRYLTETIDVPGSLDHEGITYYNLDMVQVDGYSANNPSDADELTMLLAIFERENPQYYFIDSSTFFYQSSGSNIDGIYLTVYPKFVSGAQRASYTNQIFDKIDAYGNQINDYVATNYKNKKNTTYIKEDMANDLVCEATSYNTSAEYHQSIYSVFINGSSVCNGYALATSAILNSIGVKVVAPISSNHCWIKTKLDDGSWYATDPTWNDVGTMSTDYYLDKSDVNLKANDGTSYAHEITWPQFYPASSQDYTRPTNDTEVYADTDAKQDTPANTNSNANNSNNASNSSNANGNSNNASNANNASNPNNNASGSSNAANQNGSDEVVVPEPVEVPDTVDMSADSNDKEVSSTPDTGNAGTIPGTAAGTSTSNSASGSPTVEKPAHCNEWINGKWYNEDGTQSYSATIGWYKGSSGWWVMDSSGWYPTSTWQKIDGYFYYFDASGYMAANEWVDGYYINSDGTWTYAPVGSWGSDGSGWWYGDSSGWYVTNSWQKIDGNWYYFNSQGYMVTNSYIDGYWLGADGICR